MFCLVFVSFLFNIVPVSLLYSLYCFCFRSVASRLDNTWKGFASGLDERTTVLALSVLFHHKAENVSVVNLGKVQHCYKQATPKLPTPLAN